MPRKVTTACQPTGITELATRGEELIAALGEHYLREHFRGNCSSGDPIFDAARLEGFSRGCFPRILVDPWLLLGRAPTAASLKADLDYVRRIVDERPQAFLQLFDRLDDLEGFTELVEELGLTESAAARAGGGLLALIVVLVACVVISGCTDPTFCPSVDPVTGQRCKKPNGHVPGGPGTHVNNGNGRNASW
jgi:hypothetical protein